MKRRDALLGRWPSNSTIEWVPDLKGEALAAGVRRVEGKDCNLAGDVLLYLSADGRPVVLVDEA